MGNWINVVPPIYRKGRLLESESSDCIKIRWTPLDPSIDFICDDCGYMRWVNLDPSTDYLCSGVTKMYKQQLQESLDSGATWQNVVPPVYRMGEAYQYYSADCGYAERWINIPIYEDYWCERCETDYSKMYFTTIAEEDNVTISVNAVATIYYSFDDGESWLHGLSDSGLTINNGEKILWKMIPGEPRIGIAHFSSTGLFSVEGNVMSLFYGDDFIGQTRFPNDYYTTGNCASMFGGCTGLTSAENLSLPVTALTKRCYDSMFQGCTSLDNPPTLPATTLAGGCYEHMFDNCTSLTTAPSLPATTLADDCYYFMFKGCTSLDRMPELPATALTKSCYESMFRDCTSLEIVRDLSATTLAIYSYASMFQGCTSLVNPPTLSAATLAGYCCHSMFMDCTNLTKSPILLAETLEESCYQNMFWNCSSLREIKCNSYNGGSYFSVSNWVKNVAQSGVFYKHINANWSRGDSGIPSGWTVQNL